MKVIDAMIVLHTLQFLLSGGKCHCVPVFVSWHVNPAQLGLVGGQSETTKQTANSNLKQIQEQRAHSQTVEMMNEQKLADRIRKNTSCLSTHSRTNISPAAEERKKTLI